MEHFVGMFQENIILTKIMWRLELWKVFMLPELQKRRYKGKYYNACLPDHMPAPAAPAADQRGTQLVSTLDAKMNLAIR